MGYIYMHVNKITGKKYVGQTVQELERRFRESDQVYRSYKSCTAFFNALVEYGWSNFITYILEGDVPDDKLNEREEYHINLNKTYAPHGYNLKIVSEGRQRQSNETKEKISKKVKEAYDRGAYDNMKRNRIEHKIIDNKEYKYCSRCKTYKLLDDYNNNKKRWDGCCIYCRECSNSLREKYR
jgi:group I intron endonuclease